MSAYDKVLLARAKDRPTGLSYIENIFTGFMELHGDRRFADDPAIVGGLAQLGGMPVTVIAMEKGGDMKDKVRRNFGAPNPEGYRKALRLMKQAEKFHRPVVCFVDTSGAYCGLGAEERGQGEAIARNLLEFSRLKVPVISIVLGEAGSGGALALGVCDELYMLENALYSVISPRGFASILWKDASKEKEAAEKMKMTAEDLLGFGICDGIIPEPAGGAHVSPEVMAGSIADTILLSLQKLTQKSVANLLEARYNKFRKIGAFEEQADFAKPAPEGLE